MYSRGSFNLERPVRLAARPLGLWEGDWPGPKRDIRGSDTPGISPGLPREDGKREPWSDRDVESESCFFFKCENLDGLLDDDEPVLGSCGLPGVVIPGIMPNLVPGLIPGTTRSVELA